MMDSKLLHNLTWIPLFVIGLFGAVLGVFWLMADEPWLLDRAANESTLGITFSELFETEINQTLPDYIAMVYRFSGLWLLGFGAMVCTYVLITFLGTPRSRNNLLIVLGALFVVLFYMEYTLIARSFFVNLTYGLLALYLISVWATLRLNKEEEGAR
ncbi:MAG: hypothetical protein V3U24_09940 [Candidatus Neomarinimicrobiota bacterium]